MINVTLQSKFKTPTIFVEIKLSYITNISKTAFSLHEYNVLGVVIKRVTKSA